MARSGILEQSRDDEEVERTQLHAGSDRGLRPLGHATKRAGEFRSEPLSPDWWARHRPIGNGRMELADCRFCFGQEVDTHTLGKARNINQTASVRAALPSKLQLRGD